MNKKKLSSCNKFKKESKEKHNCLCQCCGAGAGRSQGFLGGAGTDLKFDLKPEPIILGPLRLLFLARDKRNDLKMFNLLSVFGTKSRFIEAFLLKIIFFKCFLSKSVLFRARTGRSRAFGGGAGPDIIIFYT